MKPLPKLAIGEQYFSKIRTGYLTIKEILQENPIKERTFILKHPNQEVKQVINRITKLKFYNDSGMHPNEFRINALLKGMRNCWIPKEAI